MGQSAFPHYAVSRVCHAGRDIIVNPDLHELLQYRMERARETLDEALLLSHAKHWNACANRLYYACFYAVSALLAAHHFSASKHSGVRSFFGQHFIKTGVFPKEMGEFYNQLYACREVSDYEDFYQARPEEIQPWLEKSKGFVEAIQLHLDFQKGQK